jgi:myosin heavy subunit
MTRDIRSQSVIISGESGAGKTEATKLVLQYIAEISGQGNDVEQQLLNANPIIEAFGNAKTVRNNNSSRFGRWCEIMMNDKFMICGAKITEYLLEKVRIVSPNPGERNYHFFYQMCAGATPSMRQKYGIGRANEYNFLAKSKVFDIDGVDDSVDFNEVMECFKVLQFSDADIDGILRTTAGILYFGNITFNQSGDKASVADHDTLKQAASLLGLDTANMEKALVSQKKMMGRESILTVLDKVQAENNRDAIAKALYGNMFHWLIERLNVTLAQTKVKSNVMIGVLDIFGFEIFDVNSFEQFCINFANEKMQQHFNNEIFTMEQKAYAEDGIDVAHVEFVDNQACLDLIEKGKGSVMGMLDEELKIPKGSDLTYLDRMNKAHGKNAFYQFPKLAAPVFTIVHYAGPVTYNVTNFLEKNKDSVGVDAVEAIRMSSQKFVSNLFPATMSKDTLGTQFVSQLNLLMKMLNATQPHFIRCIKSNNIKVRDTFDSNFVLRQLRYLGLKEVVRIRQLGYPIRRPIPEFVKRYALLAAGGALSPVQACEAIFKNMPQVNAVDWRVGKTKVFLRMVSAAALEKARDAAMYASVVKVQSLVRRRIANKRMKRLVQVNRDLVNAIAGTDHKLIDSVLQEYEKTLKGAAKPKLIQAAVRRRNLLHQQEQAARALENAFKTKDEGLLKAALKSADAVEFDKSVPIYKQCADYLRDLTAYKADLEKAMAQKSIEQLGSALARAAQLGISGQRESEAKALLETLREEFALRQRLQDAMKSRDLEALKHALQVAMSAKSGAMVDSALERAKAAGLLDDPLVKEALAMEKTLEKEVSVYKLAAELQAAIATNDLLILEKTITIADNNNFRTHAKYLEAVALRDRLRAKRTALEGLKAALASKSMEAISSALAAASGPGLELASSGEFVEASRYKQEGEELLKKMRAGSFTAEDLAHAESMGLDAALIDKCKKTFNANFNAKDAPAKLQAALDARDKNMLRAAISICKNLPDSVPAELLQQAEALYAELAALEQSMKQELAAADAAVQRQNNEMAAAPGGRRASVAGGRRASAAGAAPPPQQSASPFFDEEKYKDETYAFYRFGDLRSTNSYAADKIYKKEESKSKMLRFIKSVIPNSLTKLNEDPKLAESAVEMFKAIQGFMLDRQYSFPDSLVPDLLSQACSTHALRNELFALIMKQLIFNPRLESLQRGWSLMALYCGHVAPTWEFLPFLLHFLYRKANPSGFPAEEDEQLASADASLTSLRNYAAYAIFALEHTVGRLNSLGVMNDFASVSLPPIPVTLKPEDVSVFRERAFTSNEVSVFLPDGTKVCIHVDPWLTNADIVPKVAAAAGIKCHAGLAVFEEKGEDSLCLGESENLLDYQKQWVKTVQREQPKKSGFFSKLFGSSKEEETKAEVEVVVDNSRRFMLRRRVLAPPQNKEQFPERTSEVLLYHEFTRSLSKGFHYLSVDTTTALAAISKVVAEGGKVAPLGQPHDAKAMTHSRKTSDASGDMTSTLVGCPPPQVSLWSVCPPNLLSGKLKTSAKDYNKAIEALLARNEVKSAKMETVMIMGRQVPTFGAIFYRVSYLQDKMYPAAVTLAINFSGLTVQDSETKAELDHFPITSIVAWSPTPVMLLIKCKIKTEGKEDGGKTIETLRFNTPAPKTAKEICDLLMAYAQEMVKVIAAQKKAAAAAK